MLLSRHLRKHVLALVVIPILIWSSKVSTETGRSVIVVNTSVLPMDLEVIDTLCNVILFQGRIVGNSQIKTRPACVDRNRKVSLILVDLSRGQSYRFIEPIIAAPEGLPTTIRLRRGSI
jgi:hypothetical protein